MEAARETQNLPPPTKMLFAQFNCCTFIWQKFKYSLEGPSLTLRCGALSTAGASSYGSGASSSRNGPGCREGARASPSTDARCPCALAPTWSWRLPQATAPGPWREAVPAALFCFVFLFWQQV